MTTETEPQETPEQEAQFAKGYYVFMGILGGLFVTVALILTLAIGIPQVIEYFEWSGTPEAGGEPSEPGAGGEADASNGEDLFVVTCAACHGPNAEGVSGLGPALADNEFVQGLSDDDLITFIEVGRATDDPDNTTGVAMPPKGGNPSLTDSDLVDIVAFLRTIN